MDFRGAEHLLGDALDVPAFKLVLGDEFADESLLLFRAEPDGGGFVGVVGLTWDLSAVDVTGNESCVLVFLVHAFLSVR